MQGMREELALPLMQLHPNAQQKAGASVHNLALLHEGRVAHDPVMFV